MPFVMDDYDEEQNAKAQAFLNDAQETCRKARACGIDTAAPDAMCEALRSRLDAFRREFSKRRVE